MQIVRHRHRRDAEETLQMVQRLAKELHGLQVFEIADVLAEDGVPIFGQAERVLQFAAAGQNFGQRHRELDGLGRVAARPAHRIFAAFEDLDDRIVHARLDLAIVQQEIIGERVQPRPRVLVAADDGFFAHIAAGHHQSVD